LRQAPQRRQPNPLVQNEHCEEDAEHRLKVSDHSCPNGAQKRAVKFREQVANKMTPVQIAKAQLASEWKPQ
jgi:hypothetical protein